MAAPSGKSSFSQEDSFKGSRAKLRQIKSIAEDLRTTILAGDTPIDEMMIVPTNIQDAIDFWTITKLVSGIDQYAKNQLGRPPLNYSGELDTVEVSASVVSAWLIANIPQVGGFIQARSFDGNGRMVRNVMNTAATAPLVPLLDILIAAIED